MKVLGPRGVLTEADTDTFALLCKLISDERELELEADKLLLGGQDWKRVYVALKDVRNQIVQLSARFGLTPADRTRVKEPAGLPAPSGKDAGGKGDFFPKRKPKLVG